jgi:hypothetical protein
MRLQRIRENSQFDKNIQGAWTHNVTDLKEELTDFLRAVQTNPQLKTAIENPGPGGFSVSYKLPSK